MADSPRLRQIDLFENLPDPVPAPKPEAPGARRGPGAPATAENSRQQPPVDEKTAPRVRFKWRHLVLVLLIGGLVTAWSWYNSRMTDITMVTVSDHYFTDEDDIVRVAGIPVGSSADSIVYADVIRRIEGLPYVREARIVQVPPGTILIKVEERRPVGLIAEGGQLRYVDSEGWLLPVIPGKAMEVPLLYGLDVPARADSLGGSAFRSMGAFLEALDRYDVAKITISDVAWQAGIGIVAVGGDYGTPIVFGIDDYDTKLRSWQAFYAQVVPKAGLQPFTRIDLRYRGQIVTEKSGSSL